MSTERETFVELILLFVTNWDRSFLLYLKRSVLKRRLSQYLILQCC